MKISINNPCHENWDEMTSNEKGAFCLACQKTVVDFSIKTTEEIKSFFSSISSSEKVCGRFKENQLTELSFDDFFQRFKKWILPRKIAVIMFFVFGLSLFSCQTTKQEPLMGKVAVSAKASANPDELIEPTEMLLGEVEAPPVKTETITPKTTKHQKQPEEIERNYLKGDVAFEPDTIKKTKCVPIDSTLSKPKIMGIIKRVE